DEKDAIRSLDLLYRRVEAEILKREATPAMRLLNDLLIMYDGFAFHEWLKKCKKIMTDTFPREDPYSILVPPGFESFDIDKHHGPLRPQLEIDDNTLLRVDFIREVDELLQEVRLEMDEEENEQGFDPESVANRLKQQEKKQTISQVEALLELAIVTMGKSSLSLLSLSLLLFTSACFATRSEFNRFNQCQLDSINALEPDHRVESEAGLTETWNPNHPELQCAGVSLIRRTIDPNGLHLPSYSPSPQLIFIIQGKGVLGLSVPGCPETFEELRSSQSRQGSRQQQPDSHQKIRRFYKGDVIAIPPGIPYWTYNHGNEPVIAISLLDTSNDVNQLDSTPRVFYLGGNPEAEFPETQEQQQGRHQQRHRESFPAGRRGGQHQQEQESEDQNDGNSVLSGFSSEFLAQALNTNQDVAKRLQSPRDKRSQIVRVEEGLRIISPEWQQED
ncbi:legumin B, partial [Trifolium pratense]